MTGPEVKTNIPTDDFDPSHLRGARLGRYELLVGIGKGGMASVWVGRDTTGKQPGLVAIKVIRGELASEPKARTMFLVEGALVAAIRHKHVVRVYEVSQYEGVLYMVMEWVEGSALHALISEANKRRAIPAEHAVRLIADTAGGLHAAHEMRDPKGVPREVVHCDVSPQNILVGLDGTTKLVDFGVASAVGRLNTQGAAPWVRGKVGYMSPEQTRAESLDRRSDIFSLGIVLFELTTGYRLFRGKDNRHTVELVRQARIPRPTQTLSDYPKSLEAVVLKALQRDPARRYQTAEEFKGALEQYLREERIVVAPAGVGGLVRRVLGPRIEYHRQLIQEAMTALDGGPEARAKWLATPPSPGPQVVKTTVTETSSSMQRAGSPVPPAPEPEPVAARRSSLMSKSQVYWTLWAMCIAALSVYAWWLY